MAIQEVHYTYDGLYDRVRGDRDDFIDEEEFRVKVDELVDIGYMETSILDDVTLYSAKSGFKWSDFFHIDDSDKKSILLLLVDNPTTFFVLQNTQKGKMRIASSEIKTWGQDLTKKVVAFLIVDNDKTLADQSVDGVIRTFDQQGFRPFTLSSTSKDGYENIKSYIDAYATEEVEEGATPEYCMPVIILLANPKQNEKMLRLLHHIHKKVTQNTKKKSLLRYGIIWDEADKTYPSLRNKEYVIDDTSASCYTYIVEKNDALYRLGFVSATDGELLEENYPECNNAYLYPAEIAPEDQEHYRALHHPESITHKVPFTSKHTNNSYAMQILESNRDHFMTPISLPTGGLYYRKTIVNSNAKTEDMKQFALWCNKKGINALVFNGYGGTSVKVYQIDARVETFKSKGKKLNELLFYIYKIRSLHDKPLVIIGRRKVDRGLGFHFSPRTDAEIIIDGEYGQVISRNKEGLIWTDEILGRVDDKNTAVQKAGRLAGIIGNSPQYPGATHYWTDEYTENLIRRHNHVVDRSNTLSGCSVLQAVEHAKSMIPEIRVNHRVELKTFLVYNNEDVVRNVCKALGYHYRSTPKTMEGPNKGFCETSLNTMRAKVSLLDAIKKVPTAYGTNNGIKTWRTCYPCYKDIEDPTSLHFVIIIRPNDVDTPNLQEVRARYPPLIIPQEGDF